jgi:hypothetical protein
MDFDFIDDADLIPFSELEAEHGKVVNVTHQMGPDGDIETYWFEDGTVVGDYRIRFGA